MNLKRLLMTYAAFLVLLSAVVILAFSIAYPQDDTEGKIRTVYDATGRVASQSQDAKGWHIVQDSVKLEAGQALVELNTSTTDGRQDISFRSAKAYSGTAWIPDSTNTNTYRVVPLTGGLCQVRSSDAGDTLMVYFRLEGE